MNRDITVNLTAAEAKVLLAFLRNPDGAGIPTTIDGGRWLGPTLTTIRQRVEAAIATAPPRHIWTADHVHTWIIAPDWRTEPNKQGEECSSCRALRIVGIAAESESELRAAHGDR